MKLNIKDWKEFKMELLFDIHAGRYHYKNEYSSGNTPYVSASNINNAISEYIDLEPDFNGNCIVTGKVGCTAFYQPKDFCATSDVNIFVPKFKLNQYIGLFIVAVLNKSENYKWGYGRQCRVKNSKNIKIKLPVCYETSNDGKKTLKLDTECTYSSDGYIPDFVFMERYIKSLHSKPVTTNVNKNSSLLQINTGGWHEFILSDIFDIKKGKRLTKADQTDGKTPYIGATDSNNGLANYIGQQPLHDGNTITLSYNGSVGEAFYQPVPFWATDDVNVLYFRKENGVEFNKYIALFICTILKKEKYRYSYGRKWTLENMKNSIIRLPSVLKNDEFFPDFEYMEKYIKQLYYSDRIL